MIASPLVSHARRLCALLVVASAPAWAAPGGMIKDDDVRAAPNATAKVLTRAAKGSAVEVVARQGGWTQIRVGGQTGWVRVLSVRGTAEGGASLSDAVALTQRRQGKVVAVAGVRGLNEEELKSARFDAGELVKLDRFAVSEADARQFARAGKLVARPVDYLPDPADTSGSAEGSATSSGFPNYGE